MFSLKKKNISLYDKDYQSQASTEEEFQKEISAHTLFEFNNL